MNRYGRLGARRGQARLHQTGRRASIASGLGGLVRGGLGSPCRLGVVPPGPERNLLWVGEGVVGSFRDNEEYVENVGGKKKKQCGYANMSKRKCKTQTGTNVAIGAWPRQALLGKARQSHRSTRWEKESGERLSRFARSEAIDWRGGLPPPVPVMSGTDTTTTTTTTTTTRDRAHAHGRPGRQAQAGWCGAVLVSLFWLKLRVLEAGHDAGATEPPRPLPPARLTRVKPKDAGNHHDTLQSHRRPRPSGLVSLPSACMSRIHQRMAAAGARHALHTWYWL